MRGTALYVAVVLAAAAATACGYSNPFCVSATMRNTVSAIMECAPGAGNISSISFAAFGTPSGSCGSFAHNASCDYAAFAAYVNAVSCTGCVSFSTNMNMGCLGGVEGGVHPPSLCAGVHGTVCVCYNCVPWCLASHSSFRQVDVPEPAIVHGNLGQLP
jgi:hypothetical protein